MDAPASSPLSGRPWNRTLGRHRRDACNRPGLIETTMKNFLLFLLTAVLIHAETPKTALPTATITADTKLELTKTKGTIGLRAGSKVDVIGKEGDSLVVLYRNIPGLVPRVKTDFKGELPKSSGSTSAPVAEPKANVAAATPAPPATVKPTDPKPVEANAPTAPKVTNSQSAPPSSHREPTTNYGKAVKKARDNAASHQENLVDPTNEVIEAPKKK